MATQLQVTFDCADPAAQSAFWAEALGYVVQPPPEGFDSWERFLESVGVPKERHGAASAAVDPAGKGPRLFFQRVPEGKTAKNRVHLDLHTQIGLEPPEVDAHRAAEVRRLESLGAIAHEEKTELGLTWVVMTDPEGNEFCVS